MPEDVIRVPFADQFVEGITLDIPSLGLPMDDSPDRNLGSRQRGHPDPVTTLWFLLLLGLPVYRMVLHGTNDAHGGSKSFGRMNVNRRGLWRK
jgi:hypothetical protein